MKRPLFLSLFLILLLALAACGNSPAAPAAVAEVAPTDPPPTLTPEPSPTVEPTATAAPTATVAPAATDEPVCDIERAREATENIALFDSYALTVRGYIQMPEDQVRLPVLLVNSTVALTGGQVSALEMTSESVEQEEAFHLILVDGQLYFRTGAEPWQVATELVGELMASDVAGGQAIDPNVLEVLVDLPCVPFSERVDGQDAAGYQFTGVDLVELAAVSSSMVNIGDVPIEDIQSSEFRLWVAEVEDVPVVVRWQFDMVIDVGEGDAQVETGAVVSEFNEPVDIRAPQGVVAVAFPLALPRPDDALVYLEDATTLAFFTAATPEDMKTFYVDALTADGWTAGETSKQTVNGQNVELTRFSRDDEALEMAIAVTATNTLVALTLSP